MSGIRCTLNLRVEWRNVVAGVLEGHRREVWFSRLGTWGRTKASCMEPAYPEREVAFRVAWYPVTERGRIRTGADRSGMHAHYERTLETQGRIHRANPINSLSGGNI